MGREIKQVKVINKRKMLLLDPVLIINLTFGIQFFLWLFFMPTGKSIVFGVASKFWTFNALMKLILFWMLFVLGIFFGESTVNTFGHPSSFYKPKSKYAFKFYGRMSAIATLLFIIGEFFYILALIKNPYIFKLAQEKGFTVLGDYVHNNAVVGLSSLNNVFLVPTAIWSLLAFSPELPSHISKKYRSYLFLLGVVIVLHGIFLAGRMFVVCYFSVVFGAFLISSNFKLSAKLKKRIVLYILVLFAIIFLGEYMRSGILYAHITSNPLFSVNVFKYEISRLIQGYVCSDFNNAMIILSYPSSMQLVSTSGFFRRIAAFFGLHYHSYSIIRLYGSFFGTVNIFGLWWFDWGWITPIISLMVGFWIGILYKTMYKSNSNLSLRNILFLIAYPGFFSLSRINYYGLSIYLIPSLYTILFFFLSPKNWSNARESSKEEAIMEVDAQ